MLALIILYVVILKNVIRLSVIQMRVVMLYVNLLIVILLVPFGGLSFRFHVIMLCHSDLLIVILPNVVAPF